MIESIPLDSRGKEIPGSKGAEGRDLIDLLFKLEDEMKDLSPEIRKEKRQVASRDMFYHVKTLVYGIKMLSKMR